MTSYTRAAAERPKVAVIVVVDRQPNDPLLAEAFESLQVQSYPNIDVMALDNRTEGLTIGAARNAAIRNTDAQFVTFMDQVDQLKPDAISSMVDLFELHHQDIEGLKLLTLGSLVQRKDGDQYLTSQASPGLWLREFVAEHPFGDDPDTWPNAPMSRTFTKLSNRAPQCRHAGHHFGYVFRDVPFRRDGIRL